VSVYGIIKIIFIKSKLNIQPFSRNTLKILVVISAVYFIIDFWNFSLHPILNILLKGVLITVIYLVIIKRLHISEDLNKLFSKYF
jgi:hypothetical protein